MPSIKKDIVFYHSIIYQVKHTLIKQRIRRLKNEYIEETIQSTISIETTNMPGHREVTNCKNQLIKLIVTNSDEENKINIPHNCETSTS